MFKLKCSTCHLSPVTRSELNSFIKVRGSYSFKNYSHYNMIRKIMDSYGYGRIPTGSITTQFIHLISTYLIKGFI